MQILLGRLDPVNRRRRYEGILEVDWCLPRQPFCGWKVDVVYQDVVPWRDCSDLPDEDIVVVQPSPYSIGQEEACQRDSGEILTAS